MKTIATVNVELPTADEYMDYHSGNSFLDYDIIMFNPELPHERRIEFTGGGSCISIEGTEKIQKSMHHWKGEIKEALNAGKTIFCLLNEIEIDSGTTNYTTNAKGSRNYTTFLINNYDVLPLKINIRNAKGQNLKIADNQYKGLYDAIKNIAEYKVVFTSPLGRKIFTTKDGSNIISTVIEFNEFKGHLVLLPYLDFTEMTEFDESEGDDVWSEDAILTSKKFVNQMVEIDKLLKSQVLGTIQPDWIKSITQPEEIIESNKKIQKYESEIIELNKKIEIVNETKNELLSYMHLIYENGKLLELAIEKSLKLLGYKVENFRNNDLEIDHIIVSPEGYRMIGESEGKDNSAIDITKFRQLESNINEDFEREEISEPAKGVLFGNGYRFINPKNRHEQFTQKCLTNAKRLGTALIRTTDLYKVVLYILNNKKDKTFQKKCRNAIENTKGDIVQFPIKDN